MDRPLLRPLDAYPIKRDGKYFLKLRDASRLSDFEATLPPEAVAVVQLFDGELDRDGICKEFQLRYRQPLPREALDQLIQQLDQALLLDSDRFRQYSAGVFAEFARAPVRMPLFAGHSYPAKPSELRTLLDSFFDPPRGPGKPAGGSAARPKAIIAPHVDFNRGGPAYAWAYRPLLDSLDDPPELVVLLGTDHGGHEHPFTLTRKHFDTPLGRLETDLDLVDRIAAGEKDAGEHLFADEHHHRGEHSLEFQAVWLKYVYGARTEGMKVLPVLCGLLSEYIERGEDPGAAPQIGGFLGRLAEAVAGRKVLWVAGADLAHVGPQYGDREPLTNDDKASLERRDEETLKPVVGGDAAGWYREIEREQDRRRVCGLLPIYGLLSAARPGAGRLAVYAQCPGEEGSVVSIASVVY